MAENGSTAAASRMLSTSVAYWLVMKAAMLRTIPAASPAVSRESGRKKRRSASPSPMAARITPARWTVLNASCHQGRAAGVSVQNAAPNSPSSPFPVTGACRHTSLTPARLTLTGLVVNPPAARIALAPSAAAPADASAATARDGSNHGGAAGTPVAGAGEPAARRLFLRSASRRELRAPHATAMAAAPVMSTSGSETAPQASSAHTATGTYHRGGHRSMTSHASRTGTALPVWLGACSSELVKAPSAGASMTPAPTPARMIPSRPAARPLARRAARTTRMV